MSEPIIQWKDKVVYCFPECDCRGTKISKVTLVGSLAKMVDGKWKREEYKVDYNPTELDSREKAQANILQQIDKRNEKHEREND